jgi:hypothetical protein
VGVSEKVAMAAGNKMAGRPHMKGILEPSIIRSEGHEQCMRGAVTLWEINHKQQNFTSLLR